jgi:truncated hemoglobin YjbI
VVGRPPSGVQARDALERVAGVSARYADLVLGCLADAQHRIGSASELRDGIRTLARD